MPNTDYIITPKARLAFPQLTTGKPNQRGKIKYGCTLLFDKKTTEMEALTAMAKAAMTEALGGKPKPPGFKVGIKDGDQPNSMGNIPDGYAGCWVVPCSTNRPVGMVDAQVQRVLDESVFYPGCFVVAQVNCFSYNTGTNQGVAFGIANIQFAGDGERLGGAAPDPSEAFTAVPGAAAAAAKTGDSLGDLLDEPPF